MIRAVVSCYIRNLRNIAFPAQILIGDGCHGKPNRTRCNTAVGASFTFIVADRWVWYQIEDGSETTFERLDDYGRP